MPVKPPEPVVAAPAPSQPEPASQPSGPPDDLRLDVASVCEELFDPKVMSYEANRLFDDKYKDATVRWKGTARRASAYSYDFNFGDGGGTKAELDVYEVKQQYGSRTVKAFVQLPTEDADRYWRAHRRRYRVRGPPDDLRGFRQTPVRRRCPHGGLNRKIFRSIRLERNSRRDRL